LSELLNQSEKPAAADSSLAVFASGMGELRRSHNKRAVVRAPQSLLPSNRADERGAIPTGVRAQLVAHDGSLPDDVVTCENERVLSVRNTSSPAATASFNISKLIFGRIGVRLT
jgi:(S)-2-hydroxyglutarate dehydrogenase